MQKKYIDFIYQCKNSKKEINQNYVYHHIIPRLWFNSNGLLVDDSDDNLVLLTNKDHLHAHFLLFDYYNNINDIQNAYKSAYAITLFIGKNNKNNISIENMSDEDRKYFEQKYDEAFSAIQSIDFFI